jgi:hypothetical protein
VSSNKGLMRIWFDAKGRGAAVLIVAVTKSLADPWHRIFTVAATVCLVFGFFLGLWARVERTFLDQPEPKEPPRLWK